MKTLEEESKNYCMCKKCHDYFTFKHDEAKWVEHGIYSSKIATCPHCGTINVVKYQDGFNQNPNFDERYYK